MSSALPFVPLPVPVDAGGTGDTSFTAYTVLCAGVTATGSFQHVAAVGALGDVLTSNGAANLPSFQAPAAAPVTSVANSDGSLTIAPTTGSVVASIDTTHSNTWTILQTFVPSADANIGIIVKGKSASQSGSLQEWQKSDGTILGRVVGVSSNNAGRLELYNSGASLVTLGLYVAAGTGWQLVGAGGSMSCNAGVFRCDAASDDAAFTVGAVPGGWATPYGIVVFRPNVGSPPTVYAQLFGSDGGVVFKTRIDQGVPHFQIWVPAATADEVMQIQGTTTGGTRREQVDIDTVWVDATDATRKARLYLRVWDTAVREALRVEASGTAPMIGFLGASAVARQTITGDRGGNGALASFLTALATEGLITDSTTNAAGGLRLLDTQTFTSNGTWNTVTNGIVTKVVLTGGGGQGGGGGGSATTTNVRQGGGGGGAGARVEVWFKTADLGGTEDVVVGAIANAAGGGGTGANGTAGTNGNLSSFGTTVRAWAYGGGGGNAGPQGATVTAQAGGGGGGVMGAGASGSSNNIGGLPQNSNSGTGTGGAGGSGPNGAAGQPAEWGGGAGGGTTTSAAATGPAGGVSHYGGGGGGAGGGVDTLNAHRAGGAGGGGRVGATGGGGAGGGAGGSVGTGGGAGSVFGAGLGGGGGGGNSAGTGGNGGDGGIPGGGGGGGGGGTNVGGNGGAGARGEVVVYTYG